MNNTHDNTRRAELGPAPDKNPWSLTKVKSHAPCPGASNPSSAKPRKKQP